MMYEGQYVPNAADILYGSFIRYDRLFEMTKFAFYGKTDSNEVNIFIDVYSLLKGLYTNSKHLIIDSYVITSCIVNLAIHLRAYFDTRHRTHSKIYIIYGGARPSDIPNLDVVYNFKNIQLEESDSYLKNLIKDNMEAIKILTPYLYDIFTIIDYKNEFNVIAGSIISDNANQNNITPNIIYSKDPMSYQLVAFRPRTFLYRPKKKANEDASWVVTKSTLYNAYRYGELGLKKQFETSLDVKMFSIYQSICGVKSRSIPSMKNGSQTIKILEKAVRNNIFANGYNASNIMRENTAFSQFCALEGIDHMRVIAYFSAIDLEYRSILYRSTPAYMGIQSGLVNLYNPQEVRNINDKYFQKYPLDLNRV